MEIQFSFQGGEHAVSVDPATTLQELQTQVSNMTAIPAQNQKILFKGHNLLAKFEPNATLVSCGMQTGDKVLLLGATSEEEANFSTLGRSDPALRPFETDSQNPVFRARKALPTSTAQFHSITVLPQFRDQRKAHKILLRLATEPGVVRVMAKRGWVVGRLTEMYPKGEVGKEICVLGLNVNKGAEIQLRLRTDDLRGFRDYETTRQVLFHELAHIVHSEHDNNFKELMNVLEREANSTDWKRSAGNMVDHSLGISSNPQQIFSDSDSDDGPSLSIKERLGSQWHVGADENEMLRAAELRAGSMLAKQTQQSVLQPNQQTNQTYQTLSTMSQPQLQETQQVQLKTQPQPQTQPQQPQQPQTQPQQAQQAQQAKQAKQAQQPQQPQQPQPQPQPQPQDVIDTLISMGFEQNIATQARDATNNRGVEQALEFILTNNLQTTSSTPVNAEPTTQGDSRPTAVDVDMTSNTHDMDATLTDTAENTQLRARRISDHLQRLASTVASHDHLTATLTLLHKILSNALQNPNNPRFHKLKLTNPTFAESVARHPDAMTVLSLAGWLPDTSSQPPQFLVWSSKDFGALWLAVDTLRGFCESIGVLLAA